MLSLDRSYSFYSSINLESNAIMLTKQQSKNSKFISLHEKIVNNIMQYKIKQNKFVIHDIILNYNHKVKNVTTIAELDLLGNNIYGETMWLISYESILKPNSNNSYITNFEIKYPFYNDIHTKINDVKFKNINNCLQPVLDMHRPKHIVTNRQMEIIREIHDYFLIDRYIERWHPITNLSCM